MNTQTKHESGIAMSFLGFGILIGLVAGVLLFDPPSSVRMRAGFPIGVILAGSVGLVLVGGVLWVQTWLTLQREQSNSTTDEK